METERTKVSDIIGAITILRSREAGLLPQDTLKEPAVVGTLGAYMSDVTETYEKYKNKEITKEQAREETQKSTEAAVGAIVGKVYDFITKPIAEYVKSHLPKILHPTIDAVREKFKEKVVETAKKVYTKVKSWLEKIIFG